ncbi:hypothetical protein ASE14_18890 [Agromyces sp. Root81]|uniref:HNH endonuclease signature motif containing protein n=1 Tax=Agromyces sp. Root81 TaxID=1736601 RepID=UPI0006F1F2AF|nr:hypothetical protein ASE14_18890 [Agromyces sp. Root81]
MICTGGIQTVVHDDAGRILSLGSPERCFTPHQRRAITLRDGGCLIPGCTVPAAWCEIHHVTPDSDGGPTHTDNGVLLCWFHHRSIDTSGWAIRMRHGVPEIRPPSWLDPGGRWRTTTTSPTRLADRLDRRYAPTILARPRRPMAHHHHLTHPTRRPTRPPLRATRTRIGLSAGAGNRPGVDRRQGCVKMESTCR